jgi:hypothetical protein
MCHGITEEVLRALSNCHKLEEVELTDAPQLIGEGSLIALAEGCPALEVLKLLVQAEVTMDVLRALSRCCPGLVCLESKLTDELEGHCEEISSLLPRCEVKWSEESEESQESQDDQGEEDRDNGDSEGDEGVEDDEEAA